MKIPIHFFSITKKQYTFLLYLMELLNIDPIILCAESTTKYARKIESVSQLSKNEATEIISNCVDEATELNLLKPKEPKIEDDIPF